MPSTIQLGANLPIVSDWQGTNIFTDLMKQCRGLSAYRDPAEIPADMPVDANGNPLDNFGIVVKSPLREGDAGEYQIRFRGKAIVSALPDIVQVGNQRVEGDWQVADLTLPVEALSTQEGYKEGILMLRFRDLQGEAVRDISLVKKEFIRADGTYPTFHPGWVEHLRRFKVLRFMNWMSYWNPIPVINWSDRPSKNRLTQADTKGFETTMVRGVAAEYIVELANLISCDIWINIPPLATDDYVGGLADFLATNLGTTQKVYTEYGNEIWAVGQFINEATWQGAANLDQAMMEIYAGDRELNYDNRSLFNADNRYIFATRRYARRTKQIGEMFKNRFERNRTGDAVRIRPVYCYQSVNPEATLVEGLDFLERQYGSVANAVWGISPKTGVAEGFINKPKDQITEADVIANMRESLGNIIGGFPVGDQATPVLEQAAALAAWHGVAFAAYEGGIGFVNARQIPGDLAFNMMRNNWAIKDIYDQYLQAWFSYGNDNLLCWFIAGATDWQGANLFQEPDICGLTWTVNEQNTLPIQAIDQALNRDGYETSAGIAVPGSIDTRRHTARPRDWSNSLKNDKIWQSNHQLYLIYAPVGKQYTFQLISERNAARATATEVWINHKRITSVEIPAGNGSHTGATFKTTLRKGMNALKMVYSDGAMGNYQLIVR